MASSRRDVTVGRVDVVSCLASSRRDVTVGRDVVGRVTLVRGSVTLVVVWYRS
jgi:hypothetical protein